jgi:DNA-binding NtrC family response regulator
MERQARFYNEPSKTLSAAAMRLVLNYAWPGNIRELANAMEHAYVLTPGRLVDPSALPTQIVASGLVVSTKAGIPTLEEAKRQLLIQALEFTRFRKVAAAQLLGIERRALNRMLAKFNISLSQLRHSTAKN